MSCVYCPPKSSIRTVSCRVILVMADIGSSDTSGCGDLPDERLQVRQLGARAVTLYGPVGGARSTERRDQTGFAERLELLREAGLGGGRQHPRLRPPGRPPGLSPRPPRPPSGGPS